MDEQGWKQGTGSEIHHFELDPTKFGYNNKLEAIKENKASFEKFNKEWGKVPHNNNE